jgi:hypothetical protein
MTVAAIDVKSDAVGGRDRATCGVDVLDDVGARLRRSQR